MSWWEALILGLLQGLTEFLPVSSSGHLVLGQYVLGLNPGGVTFEVFVHFGTVLSILTVYWRRVGAIISAVGEALPRPSHWRARYQEHDPFRIAVWILITLIPTGLVYVLLGDWIEQTFEHPRFAAGMLLVTGVLLVLTRLRQHPSGDLSPLKAFVVGIAQSAAMLPGISRSGSTICAAIYQNVRPERAADFSFLMLLPVVLGATLLKGIELLRTPEAADVLPLVIGTVTAYASGVVAIKVLLQVVRRGQLVYFAYYCFLVGGLGLWLIR
ncbi:undecaprenyl-diphosphate phosphatase [Rhodothermus profundi]|uniref:Undecaprenyl-diphosphatase n=1 Tax=Rhodothermus profundi TaxID=633813 RepID=A0A1M6VYX4_9BACT|nr:undecaprenyl-diphosphate phosphatase [Rhodothermus profundi]SHK86598.1 Undecaprenyl-diphosphatase [Rhodothermus profundi]